MIHQNDDRPLLLAEAGQMVRHPSRLPRGFIAIHRGEVIAVVWGVGSVNQRCLSSLFNAARPSSRTRAYRMRDGATLYLACSVKPERRFSFVTDWG